ncbi:MAG: hypothetical protein AAF573_01160 [Bacteroidota bacterium]
MFGKNKNWVDYLFLLVLLLGSLWQVVFLHATMKWDIMDITLPWNYYLTECVANGELPLWNPFVNGGFAQMGINDTWNPITWIIGFIFGYDPVIIQWQYLGHLFFAGIGFYELGKHVGWGRTTRLTTAAAYMLSGFMIGNAQHLGWTVGASWLPWVFLHYKKWETNPALRTSLVLAALSALMFLSSYPGVFFGLTYVLIFLFITKLYRTGRSGDFSFFKKIIRSSFLAGVSFVLLTLVALVSMLRLSPYINRGESLSIESAVSGSLPWESIVTLLFPFASVADQTIWETDWTLVNLYLGLVPFVFLVFSWSKKILFRKTLPYLLGALFFFSLAMGKDLPLRGFLHHVIPLLDVFRLPSYFRIFGIFFLLIVSGFAINFFFKKENGKRYDRSLWKYFLGVALVILSISFWARRHVGIIQKEISGSPDQVATTAEIDFYGNVSYQGLIHVLLLVFLGLGFYFLKKEKLKRGLFLGVVVMDLFFSAQLNVASTVVHAVDARVVNTAFHRHSPEVYPLPDIELPFRQLHKVANFDFVHLHINLNHFHKVPTPDGSSPLYFKWVGEAMQKGTYQQAIQNPLVFGVEEIAKEEKITEEKIDTLSYEKIKLISFSPNQVELETSFGKEMKLVYLQNYHPDWKVFVDEIERRPMIFEDTFLSVLLEGESKRIKFVFDPRAEKLSFYGTLSSWLVILFILVFRKRKEGEISFL